MHLSNLPLIARKLIPTAAILTIILAVTAGASNDKDSALHKQLIGAWELTSQADGKPLDPEFVGAMKFIGDKHWCVSNIDTKTKRPKYFLGGTYTLKGDEYVETVEYASEEAANMIGQKNTFKIKIEKDTFVQIGVGNPYSETFKRAK